MFSGVYLPFDVDYWLELEIDSEILDPRQKMGMVGYAAASDTADYAGHVATVDGATGGEISGDVSIQSDLLVDGNIYATGKGTFGPGHTNSGTSAFVAGESNTASGQQSTVGGGLSNTASGLQSTIAGGYAGTASNENTTVGGGWHNVASGPVSTVAGGQNDTASANFATVGGGLQNVASGPLSTVPGGGDNVAQGPYSFAAGNKAKANHSGSFVWADNIDIDFASSGNNQFLIRASGGVGIGTNSPTAALHVNGEAKCEVGGVEFFMVPKGSIIMWSGDLDSIPSGWALCDGSNGTPNLSDKFIYSVHSGENPGAVGGTQNHYHTVDPLPYTTPLGNYYQAYQIDPFILNHGSRWDHTHQIDLPLVNSSVTPHLPPYYKLAFIMKL